MMRCAICDARELAWGDICRTCAEVIASSIITSPSVDRAAARS